MGTGVTNNEQRGTVYAFLAISVLLVALSLFAQPTPKQFDNPLHQTPVRNEGTQERRATLLFFTASWCSPCKKIGPVLEKLVRENSADLELVVIDYDEAPLEVMTFEVQEIPSMILLDPDSQLLLRVDGATKRVVDTLVAHVKAMQTLSGREKEESR